MRKTATVLSLTLTALFAVPAQAHEHEPAAASPVAETASAAAQPVVLTVKDLPEGKWEAFGTVEEVQVIEPGKAASGDTAGSVGATAATGAAAVAGAGSTALRNVSLLGGFLGALVDGHRQGTRLQAFNIRLDDGRHFVMSQGGYRPWKVGERARVLKRDDGLIRVLKP